MIWRGSLFADFGKIFDMGWRQRATALPPGASCPGALANCCFRVGSLLTRGRRANKVAAKEESVVSVVNQNLGFPSLWRKISAPTGTPSPALLAALSDKYTVLHRAGEVAARRYGRVVGDNHHRLPVFLG